MATDLAVLGQRCRDEQNNADFGKYMRGSASEILELSHPMREMLEGAMR
jgi:hypothetical protein